MIPQDANSLGRDAVYTLIEDRNGMLWLGTDGAGVDRFDPVTETFTHYRKANRQLSSDRVIVVFEDSHGVLWVGTDGGGLNRFDSQTGNFHTYRANSQDPAAISHDNVRAIFEDPQGNLWIGTDKGVNLYDRQVDAFSHLHSEFPVPETLMNDSIRTIYTDADNNVWFGTYQSGLTRLTSEGRFHVYRHDPDKSDSLCHNRVRSVLQARSGHVWVATDEGLCRWQGVGNRFVRFRHDPQDLYSIGDNRTLSLYQDRGDVMWLGTFGGLNRWSASGFAHYRHEPERSGSLSSNIITAFAESGNGDIWVGSYDGLNRLDRQSGLFERIGKAQGLGDDRIMSLHHDTDGRLWIGTRGNGLDRYDPASGEVVNFRHDPQNPGSLSGNGVTDIFADDENTLWVAVYGGGLNRFNRTDGTFTQLRHDPDNSQSLGSDRILSIHQSRDGLLWIGTEGGGLNRFDRKTGEVQRYMHDAEDPASLSNDVAWSIFESDNGDLWVGTWGGGINRWRSEDRRAGKVKFVHYGKKQGLASATIYDIVADKSGLLWFSSNRGLTRFNPASGQFRQFDVSHGLQDNEFNLNAAMAASSGELFFGGSNGFNAFYPERIGANRHKPQVALTAMQVLNKQSGNMVRHKGFSDLVFGYQDYAVTFDFAGLDFRAPGQNRYQYKLEGFDDDWVELSHARRTTFTNLPADDYVFRVKAANNDGVWSETGLSIPFTVTPAPWKTWWAYTLYGLAVMGLVLLYLAHQARKLREKAEYSRQLERQVAERTHELTEANAALEVAKSAAESGNRAKGTFIATMSHELRTPMTAIIGFAESLLEDRVDGNEGRHRLGKILGNARHLLQLMNNVLDISKVEANKLELEQTELHPGVILDQLQDLIGHLAQRKQLAFETEVCYPVPAQIAGDPTRLQQILLNLASNAIKFTEQGSVKVRMWAQQDAERLYFSVEDTGVGIDEHKQSSVFDAFAQADSSTTRKFGGTGLGLSISRQLVEAMGGEMTLTSEPGKGSCFSFYIKMPASQHWLEDAEAYATFHQAQIDDNWETPLLHGHILLAEDWPDNQELIQMYIRRTGAKVTLVDNGQAAVEQALAQPFDMILMDVQMPLVDGIEATDILRATGFANPIIALTANVSAEDVAHYQDCGFDGHLAKPIERTAFYRTLSEHLPASEEPQGIRDAAAEQEYQQLLGQFLRRLPELMIQVEAAAEQQQWDKLQRLLHNLKGMGGSFGFDDLSALAEPMYNALADNDPGGAVMLLEELNELAAQISQSPREAAA